MNKMSAENWGLLIILSILWGGSFISAKVAVDQYDVISVVFWRVSLAAIILLGLILIVRESIPTSLRVWSAFIVMSLLNNVIPMFLIFYGLTKISSGLSAILNATTPLFTVLVMHFFSQDERATFLKFLGVFIGFLGVIVLMGVNLLTGISDAFIAALASLGGALSYAFSGLWGKRFKTMQVKPMIIAFGQLACSTIFTLIAVIFLGANAFEWPKTMVIAFNLFTLAALSTALAYIIFFKIMNSSGVSNIMLVTFLIPVSALILGVIFLNESIMMQHIAGIGLIGLGLICIDGRLLKHLTSRVHM